MPSPVQPRQRKAFTLIELVIVIFLVGLVIALGIQGFEKQEQKPQPLTPLNLKSTLIQNHIFDKEATFMCLNKCKQCYWRDSIEAPFQPYEHPLALGEVTAYILDHDNNLQDIEYDRYDDQKICLLMQFYPNGSSTQLILEDDQRSYFLPALFGEAAAFDSPEEARDHWLETASLVSKSGTFY
ncbi:MAG TPA: prepilin-type N-terminal cleavage/methylation domain-containing protein [Epsilonproteobacteria bacterium]|nr:prepilin-type N-terminal cleavage/methylation domain-containing protein [Campylobacterota bacterium]